MCDMPGRGDFLYSSEYLAARDKEKSPTKTELLDRIKVLEKEVQDLKALFELHLIRKQERNNICPTYIHHS